MSHTILKDMSSQNDRPTPARVLRIAQKLCVFNSLYSTANWKVEVHTNWVFGR